MVFKSDPFDQYITNVRDKPLIQIMSLSFE